MATEISHHDSHGEGHEHHVAPVRDYVFTFLALLVLMILTVIASQYNFGVANNLIAMAIAITKATMVVLIFMGVRHNTRLTWLWAGLGFVWFLLLFGILSDYYTRGWIPVPGWEQAAPDGVKTETPAIQGTQGQTNTP